MAKHGPEEPKHPAEIPIVNYSPFSKEFFNIDLLQSILNMAADGKAVAPKLSNVDKRFRHARALTFSKRLGVDASHWEAAVKAQLDKIKYLLDNQADIELQFNVLEEVIAQFNLDEGRFNGIADQVQFVKPTLAQLTQSFEKLKQCQKKKWIMNDMVAFQVREDIIFQINEILIRQKIGLQDDSTFKCIRGYLTDFPGSLLKDPGLAAYWNTIKKMQLSNNALTTLPCEIGLLTSLEVLELSNNKIMQLPDELGNLTTLNNLCAVGNQLTTLPKTIGNLKKLTYLHLSSNKLISLPTEIAELNALVSIDLNGNQFTEVPKLGKLEKLQCLLLEDNQLRDIRPEVCALPQLVLLAIAHNCLNVIPEDLRTTILFEREAEGLVTYVPISKADLLLKQKSQNGTEKNPAKHTRRSW